MALSIRDGNIIKLVHSPFYYITDFLSGIDSLPGYWVNVAFECPTGLPPYTVEGGPLHNAYTPADPKVTY